MNNYIVFLVLLPCAFALDNGLGLTPPMGYSSWNDCASQITEVRIKNVTKHMIDTGLAAKGYIHVNVDEGWLKDRDSNGNIVEDRVKFPSGMKALGEWIHDQEVPGKGKVMKYGLYTCRGTCQCGTQLYSGPGSAGHVEQDAKWLVDAGMDYLKEDSCCGSQVHEVAFGNYGDMRDALNKTGRPVYFSLCGWNTWYAPVGNSLGNSWRIAGDGQNWEKLTNCVNQNAALTQYARPGAWNDPDLLIGTGVGSNDLRTNPRGCFDPATMKQTQHWYQTELQSRTQFSMWAIMSSPLLISADVGQVSSYQLETWGNTEIIQISQTFRAQGPYQGMRVAGGDLQFNQSANSGVGTNVWIKLLPDKSFAMAFVNNEGTTAQVTCDAACFANATIAGATAYGCRDVWGKTSCGTLHAPYSITASVPGHGGVVVYRLDPTTSM